jgi:hypothetical protein
MKGIKKYLNVSILDWLGVVEGGISILLCLRILNDSYDVVYWIHPNGDWKIDFDENFKGKFKIQNPYEMENLKDLLIYIDKDVLPKRTDIWKEFELEL